MNEAFKRATEKDRLPLGVFYISSDKSTFEENIGIYQEDGEPLYKRERDIQKINQLITKFRTFN